jgi:hypothetical protein
MKIEIINNDLSNTTGYEVYDMTNKRTIKNGSSSMFPRVFHEEDIFNLLGEKKYSKFESGQYQFEVSGIEIFKATQDMNYYNPKFANRYYRK